MVINLGNDDLDIHLAAPEGWTFAPGDPVIGTIARRSRLVTPEASIWLVLKGELKVADSVGPHTHYPGPPGTTVAGERNSFSRQLLDPRKQVIFRGPLHINGSDDAGSWPFEVRVPYSSWNYTPDGDTEEGTEEGSEPPSYDGGEDGSENHSLPATFRVYGQTSCWARYYIEAEIRYILGGSPKTHITTLDIKLKTPPTPFEGYGSQRSTVTGMVQSHHLLPGTEQDGLIKKRHSFFGFAQAPRFHYQVILRVPTTMQLNNRKPFPLKFRVSMLDKTSSVVRESPPEVMLGSIKMSLVSNTYIRCQQPYQTATSSYLRSLFYTHKLRIEDAFKTIASPSPLRIPSKEKEDPLDIGDLLQLTLHSNGLMAGSTYLRKGIAIVPDMTARSTRHTHSLHVDFSVVVAGKTEEHHWAGPVKII